MFVILLDCMFVLFFFFFKQKTAYEMRISDWSSDVCSSDLPVTQTIEGRERFSVNVRLPQDYRNSIDRIKRIPIQTASMGTIPLSAVADIAFVNGPPMIS